ncbi:unnamed protein product [Heterobilharzia americana]|nr:unnamed protein product [Heterobilharzia americana]
MTTNQHGWNVDDLKLTPSLEDKHQKCIECRLWIYLSPTFLIIQGQPSKCVNFRELAVISLKNVSNLICN